METQTILGICITQYKENGEHNTNNHIVTNRGVFICKPQEGGTMNKRTLITAVASVIAFLILCINTLAGTDIHVPEDVINAIATLLAVGIMWFISYYFNQDYSEVAQKMTPIMRKIKILVKQGDLRLLDQIEHLIDTWEGDDYDDD